MFGRSTARRGAASKDGGDTVAADYGENDNALYAPETPAGRHPRAGAGGRWWVWVGRAVLWAFVLVVLFNGIWMPIRGSIAQPSENDGPESTGPSFPTTAASAFAVRFAGVYLGGEGAGDSANDDRERAEALAEFVPEGEAAAFDTTGADFTGENIEVVSVEVHDDHNAVVTLSADVNGEPMSLDVPIYAAADTALVVSGPPALLAAPTRAELPENGAPENDTDVRDELQENLEGFFEAYAETPDHLSRYVEPGAHVTELPQGTLSFHEVRDVTVPVGSGNGDDVREATATVVWRLADAGDETPADLRQTYQLTVVKDGGNWYVRDIQGAPQSFTG
ncbi:conjugal transfer protein [Allosalinactinospora lopnorensis]|uniref:conjugal transfer protein n=1 Tax=Allosalinactinospora lopnorensis TaxID=1352348 RepID=UPI000698F95A|nr:conjugal transfer protein [Allosalinactinospora lopnorensis]